MSEIWPLKPLGDVCDIIGGATPSKRKPEYYGGSINWITVKDMNFDYIESTESTVTQDAVDSCSTNIVPAGSVVIATRVGLGKVCIVAKEACFNQDIKAIIPKDGMEIDHKFLFYWFRSISDEIIGAGTGATVQGVRIPFVKQLPFPIPPLDEQERIVSILDEVFENIQNETVQIENKLLNAKGLFKSKLQSIFNAGVDNWRISLLKK